ncbi:MAG: hypothetical protein Q7T82_10770 [Armatimonadota bacterium]|nr:hypothetical protein [Armatimonadota bacterium]
MRNFYILFPIAMTFIVSALSASCATHTWWQARDMYHCGGDSRELITFDGVKSTIRVPGENKVHSLSHCIRCADYSKDSFVVEFGEVSPGVNWELIAVPLENNTQSIPLLKGSGGGTHKVPLAKMGLPTWCGADLVLRFASEKPGVMEILRWAVETPLPNRFAKQHAMAAKALVRATPLERGLVPHWNPDIGGSVCAYNAAHPEHYNYWLEDEGELLWSLGNYPTMMELYGKGLRDFIVKHCKAGAPVRKVGNQPVMANIFLKPGEYSIDTGVIHVMGNLADDPHVHIHPSVYENHGLLASIADFIVSYATPDGSEHTIDFRKPAKYSIDYDKPKKGVSRLRIEANDDRVSARFDFNILRGRVTANVEVSNVGASGLRDVTAKFTLRDCDRYYKSPFNRIKQFEKVAILYSEQPALENCNILRLAGPAAESVKVKQRPDGVIHQADTSTVLSIGLPPGKRAALKLADINCGSTSFADKIEIYENVDFEDADMSMSYVGTYPLLGLATYSYRYPGDKEAREVTNRMIDNFFAARLRLRDRELGYLLWVLNLMGRDKEAIVIADQLEKYAAGLKFDNSQSSSAMAIGLRSVGRWEAADRICANTTTRWSSVNAPTDVLGYGCLQSEPAAETCYYQLSDTLRMMYWDEPHRLTAHSMRFVEEGPQEVQAYTLICFDFILRRYGGICPVRLDPFTGTEITKMSYDAAAGEWRAALIKTGEVDVFTSFRAPKSVLWNGQELPAGNWSYNDETGVVYLKGLSGDGELTISVDGAPPKPKSSWEPIDYIGIKKRG